MELTNQLHWKSIAPNQSKELGEERTIMQNYLNRIAAILAWIIGAMGVVAGGQVLMGRLPGWNVISWLPVYNFVIGGLTVLVVGPLIWRNHRYALPSASAVLGANLVVILSLQLAFQQVVAQESIMAMLLRLTVWVVICGLLYWQRRRER
jgi:hypothetical protein